MSFIPPKTYKAMAVTRKGILEPIDIPWKDPQDGQVVVKVLACGVCHSDVLVHDQVLPTGLPRIPGHEIIGEVVALPPTEKSFKIGDRVGGGWHGGHCGICSSCRKGDFVTCQNQAINGVTMDGGFAEYATLRSEAVVRVPTDIDPAEAAPLLCAGVTTFNSMRHMNAHPGDVVAIQGVGGLGHLAIQYARAMGYRTVALSSSSSKAALAAELGAHDYIDGSKEDQAAALQKLGGAKLIVATAPSPDIIPTLINGLGADGRLLLLAVVPELKLPTGPMITKRLSVQGWPSGTAKDSEDTVSFSQVAGVRCRIEKFPLSRTNEAYQSMVTGKARFRAVLIPH